MRKLTEELTMSRRWLMALTANSHVGWGFTGEPPWRQFKVSRATETCKRLREGEWERLTREVRRKFIAM